MSVGRAAVDDKIKEFKELQEETGVLSSQRSKLYQVANENGMVKAELELLTDSATVFKLIGPVLMKQDLSEAKANVANRLELIQRQMADCVKKIEEKQGQQEELRQVISKMQAEMKELAFKEAQQAIEDAKDS